MQASQSGGTSKLLDALNSFHDPSPGGPNVPLGNGVSNSVTPELLHHARREQMKQQLNLGSSSDEDLSLLLVDPPMRGKSAVHAKVAGGFRLNYDDETLIRSIDIGGADQAQKISEFVTKGINNASHGITVKIGMEELGLKSPQDILPGLDVRLLRHQMIGVAWMLRKEKSDDKGGILADDMGLGKTVQMIATMAMNPPAIDEKETSQTTLIVVPAALLQQWKEEIDTKTNGIMTVHVHHGKDKLKKTSEVRSKDVVITTYQTLCMDFGLPKNVEDGMEEEWLAQHGGVLARTKFYRVVADEAQYIRNRATRASITMTLVKAKHRWMLTGTPVTNSLADIYGLLRFGRFRPWNDWNSFNSHVCRVQSEDALLAGNRTQTILAPVLMRRTKDSQLEGEPLLKLPRKHIEIVKLQFSDDERDLYDNFEDRSKDRINKFIKEGTLLKNHAFVLVLILRLRQMCCHPNLILAQAEEYDDPTMLLAGDADKERARAIKSKGREWVETVKERFLKRSETKVLSTYSEDGETSGSTCPRCDEPLLKVNGRILDCGHEICAECAEDIRNASMDHNGIFGYGSEKENIEAERRFEQANAKGYRPCPTNGCNRILDMAPEKLFKSIAFEPTEDDFKKLAEAKRKARQLKKRIAVQYGSSEDEGSDFGSKGKTFAERGLDDTDDDLPELGSVLAPPPPVKKRKVSGGKKKKGQNDDDEFNSTMEDITRPRHDESSTDESDTASFSKRKKSSKSKRAGNVKPSMAKQFGKDRETLLATWAKGDDDLEPSAKMIKLIEYVKEWEELGDKTICYSQWTSMLDLVETLFLRYGIRIVRFDGSMDRTSREHALSVFKSPVGPKVILISTKCGGVGLNLVAANRIVNMDLSWNYAAESQAYDRAHRIGQEKDVFVKRLVVENTIEERMLKLQEVKVGLAEVALGEGSGTKLTKLSMKDIKFLFAMNSVAPNRAQASGSHTALGGSRVNSDDEGGTD
ncbi:hypothetical protein E1B28_013349 [Marasmius oreades]|uniref:Uncharacterized protein n=1 Tax=Marasmius oreades TaxID=181124 RepID=A0A9P7UNX4_9AGAR|nr:uncharacterized protein E1B28_013349 [Marasmius oreades]KAG7087376.1 hypothetical protein E1B28_013349 [Marasmius oreades]